MQLKQNLIQLCRYIYIYIYIYRYIDISIFRYDLTRLSLLVSPTDASCLPPLPVSLRMGGQMNTHRSRRVKKTTHTHPTFPPPRREVGSEGAGRFLPQGAHPSRSGRVTSVCIAGPPCSACCPLVNMCTPTDGSSCCPIPPHPIPRTSPPPPPPLPLRSGHVSVFCVVQESVLPSVSSASRRHLLGQSRVFFLLLFRPF